MTKVLLLLSIAVTALWVYFLWSRRKFYKVYWQLRGPLGLPFIGVGLQMMKPEKFLQYMQRKGQQYKTPFISWMGSKCFLYVNDPETIETIFNSACCTNKGDFYRFMASAIGDGLFTSSTPRWNKHRRLINPSFSRQVVHTFLPTFNRETNVLIKKLMTAEGQPLEMYEILKKSVLEIACQTTMGQKMNFQNDGSATIFESYNGITEVFIKRMLSPWLYPDILYGISSLFKRQQNYTKVLYEFVGNLLQVPSSVSNSTKSSSNASILSKETMATSKTMKRHENNEKGNSIDEQSRNEHKENNEDMNRLKSRVFIEQIQHHIEEGKLTWQDVRDEANVIVAATYETTSTALYLVCLCLAMHPEYQDKLYNELVGILTRNDCDESEADITLEHLERMTYAEMVINEAMRLFAPVPMVLRAASNDFHLNDGTLIPKGTQIGIDIFNMQRSKKVWGAHADTFNPDRHFALGDKRHSFAFVPFTKGLRMCIGYRYALMLMKIMLAKIFLNFRIHTDVKIRDLSVKATISLKLCDYPLCKLEKRKPFCIGAETT